MAASEIDVYTFMKDVDLSNFLKEIWLRQLSED